MAHLEVKHKTRSYWWLWLIIILIIAAAVIYYFNVYHPVNTAMIVAPGPTYFAGTTMAKVLTAVSFLS